MPALGLKLGSDAVAHGALLLDKYVDETVQVPSTVTIPSYQWGMLGNDDWGDCVEAAGFHADETFDLKRGVTPAPWQPGSALTLYGVFGFSQNAGPPGSNPTDQGTDPAQFMAWWRDHGLAGLTPTAKPGLHALAAFGQLPANSPNLRRAIWEFGAVILAIALPDNWQSFINSAGVANFTGTVTPDPSNGHGIVANGFTPSGLEIVTWGEKGSMDNPFTASVLEQAFVPLSHEVVSSGDVGPGGFNFARMRADLSTLT